MKHELEHLLNEVRLIYQKMIEVGDRIHSDTGISMGMRAVLEFLLENGPTTVPDIARNRSVSRQHIQTLANDLLKVNLIQLEQNPGHKRSSFLALSEEGEKLIRRMRYREREFFEETPFGINSKDLDSASATLEKIRRALD